ncbi:restriction endonuclease subunit S [Gayadomonas joobiniege]|uniref:restriction endonuclease subunit S n=1 Tax=Gayadomonas joobiniege TaxID=1234606 RepID=UPI00037FA858|nr:restriction endonuclease subunit S [Gayadomonas joobiniege]
MRSNYKKLGQFIQVVDTRNKENRKDNLLGVSTQKVFIDSVANTVGTDFKKYKIVRKHQFTYVPDTSRRGDKMGIAMLDSLEQALVSQAYTVFEVKDLNLLDPEYLMMWFRRPEFDRYARFKSHGSVREIFDWQEMCDVELPVPSIEKQREIVREYNVVNDRIALNEQLIQKLEDTAQAIYKQWFIDFEFPISKEYAEFIGKPELEGKPYKSSGGDVAYSEELECEVPTIWNIGNLGTLVDMKYGKMLNSDKFTSEGFPVFSGYGIRGYYSEFMYENPEILIVCRGVSGTGNVVMSPPKAFITNLSIVASICQSSVRKGFLYYFLKFKNLRSLDSGSAQSMITIGDLEKVVVPIPQESLQESFEQIFEKVQRQQRVFNKENGKLVELKSLLLGQMYRGH